MIGIELHIAGDLASAQAIPWICHRARLLDLKGWVERESERAIVVALLGPETLIDAMEIACSLGPADIDVDSISRREHWFETRPNGFSIA